MLSVSVDRPSTECRPITDRYISQVSTNYRPTIGEVSAKCRCNVGEVSVNEKLYRPRHLERLSTVARPSVDPLSTDYRPTIDRLSTAISTDCRPSVDRVSTECRPSIDRLSTECRPTIDRVSTAISTAISTDISVDITHSKQDPGTVWEKNNCSCSLRMHKDLNKNRLTLLKLCVSSFLCGF